MPTLKQRPGQPRRRRLLIATKRRRQDIAATDSSWKAQTGDQIGWSCVAEGNRRDGTQLVRDQGPRPGAAPGQTGLFWRVVLVAMGFGMAVTGWMLILTVFVLVIDALVSLVERRLLRWRPAAAGSQA